MDGAGWLQLRQPVQIPAVQSRAMMLSEPSVAALPVRVHAALSLRLVTPHSGRRWATEGPRSALWKGPAGVEQTALCERKRLDLATEYAEVRLRAAVSARVAPLTMDFRSCSK
mmetsp:Transcript_35572/g.94642  ORF Transcript_35572/g.94642 Transcript_35572/m.94642 type:complete len:113 (-) Transcript_35572:498-836(-)